MVDRSADGGQHAGDAPIDLRTRTATKVAHRLLTEITPDDIRANCGAVVERGAPATAICRARLSIS
jgi:hypothetical protein